MLWERLTVVFMELILMHAIVPDWRIIEGSHNAALSATLDLVGKILYKILSVT